MIYYLKLVFLALLVLSALVSDIRVYKISNLTIIIFVISGLIINFVYYGLEGVANSLAGIVLPIVFLFVLFAAKMLGAGDIKLFCSIGAIMGWRYVLFCMAFSFISGGVIALIIMLAGKNFISRFKYLVNYLKCCFLATSVLQYSDFSNKNDCTKMRFSYAIVAGIFVYQLFIKLC